MRQRYRQSAVDIHGITRPYSHPRDTVRTNKQGEFSMRNLVAEISAVLAGCVTVGSDVGACRERYLPVEYDRSRVRHAGEHKHKSSQGGKRLLHQGRKAHGTGDLGGIRRLRLVAAARQSRISMPGRKRPGLSSTSTENDREPLSSQVRKLKKMVTRAGCGAFARWVLCKFDIT
jgi:hypothetical protein